MGITVNAETVGDAAHKLGLLNRRSGINIKWRKGSEHFDYVPLQLVGCIVDATDIQGEEVERCFQTSGEALRYIAGLLKKHDAYARDQAKKHRKKLREIAKGKK